MGIIAATIGVGIYLLVIWKIRKDNKELEERINRNLWLEDLVIKVPYVEK
jgi:hypothetical protein